MVFALTGSTVSVRWSFTTGSFVDSSPAVDADGSTVYVGSWDFKVYALNALTGSVRWSYTTGGAVTSLPAVSADGSTVYVGSQDYKVYALIAITPTPSPTQVRHMHIPRSGHVHMYACVHPCRAYTHKDM
jgi:outer membrane protein assembly factor BamB